MQPRSSLFAAPAPSAAKAMALRARTAQGDGGEVATAAAVDADEAVTKALAECAARIAERCAEAGVLHLALHGSGAQGLVSRWRTDVVAVAEPSASLVPGSKCQASMAFIRTGADYVISRCLALTVQTRPAKACFRKVCVQICSLRLCRR